MSVWSTVSFARSILDIAVSFFNQVADWIASLVFPLLFSQTGLSGIKNMAKNPIKGATAQM